MTAPAKKAPKKAPGKRTSRASAADVEAGLSDDELSALADDSPPALREGEFRPTVIGKRGRRGGVPVQMVTLFELDDVEHKIPRNPSAALVLRWLLDLEERGLAAANVRMAQTLLGQEPLDKLAASPEVEVDDVAEIFTNIGAVFFTSDTYRKIMEAQDPS